MIWKIKSNLKTTEKLNIRIFKMWVSVWKNCVLFLYGGLGDFGIVMSTGGSGKYSIYWIIWIKHGLIKKLTLKFWVETRLLKIQS